ncbi:hypothetical protein ITJ64_11980 [Herbiconiux sp. VKM Ac-1786]|uniref:hypothetical protein n=1 Tax=Herbiconiux sp. VKM Ac-1786 TaxID=2783824 RepID=UPI00188A6C2B|nr:hypothetical protein [Herbiconiux sp. VKM Ac-1786]MBF4573235.1 hypothetical protein [Herbiconiux sp. VKM Ac-1786]
MMIGYQEMTATQTAETTATRTADMTAVRTAETMATRMAGRTATRTAARTTTEAGSAVSWRCVQAGLWVASGEHGEPLGIVSENWGRGFAVTTAWGLDLGLHATLADAKSALEQAH